MIFFKLMRYTKRRWYEQQLTPSSPYSRYGLGDLQSSAFGRATAMGGAGIASRYNLQINSANPASYTAIDSLNFLFEFGLQLIEEVKRLPHSGKPLTQLEVVSDFSLRVSRSLGCRS